MALPGGSLVVTAGSNELKIWDLTAGAKLLQTVSAHQKSITCMCLTSRGDRLLTGGLDGHVKVYSVGDFTPVYGFKHGGAITSVALPADLTRLAVGTADGSLTVRQRTVQTSEAVMARAKSAVVRGGTYRFFLRGAGDAAAEDDVTLAAGAKQKLKSHDQLLKGFRYGAALDAALATGNSIIGTSMLTELMQRGGLRVALAGRDEESLEPLLALLVKHTSNPRFTSILTETTHAVLDLYAAVVGRSSRVRSMLAALQSRVRGEMNVQRELLKLQGGLDMLLNASGSAMAASAEAAEGGDAGGVEEAELGAGAMLGGALGPILGGLEAGEAEAETAAETAAAAFEPATSAPRKRRVSFDEREAPAEDEAASKRSTGKARATSAGRRRKSRAPSNASK
jgi:U3 small nucleolar RNA-associated protein 15